MLILLPFLSFNGQEYHPHGDVYVQSMARTHLLAYNNPFHIAKKMVWIVHFTQNCYVNEVICKVF